MKKNSAKTKIRVTILTILLIITSILFFSRAYYYVSQIIKTKNEIKDLKVTYSEKLEEEEELKNQIKKLQDPEYIARYAREKYLYSKNNEIIIKLEE